MSDKKTDVNELGEFGLIDRLTKNVDQKVDSTEFGIGDDAAVITVSDDTSLLVSTDMLIEGVHFNLMYMPLKHLGYKAVAVNVSDICAMNGVAEQITVSIAVSSRFPIEALEELYDGINTACQMYNVDLIGGDTTTSLTGLTISITAIGRAKKKEISYRSGANEFDLLVVTGDLGAAFVGLQVLEREKEVFKANPNIQPDLDGHDYIMERQLKPEARIDVIRFLKELNVVPSAMIDISDGLASEIMHLCKASNVGCRVYDEKLPIDGKTSMTAIEFNLDPVTCALNGGEDYELLFTVKQDDFDKIKGNPHMTVIGHVTDQTDGMYYVDKNGAVIELRAQGWDHFKKD
ncbi:MAG: thiamine-phosphate kinase [Crocinitomicaceae bacterium]|jgi:thiamine-monophosphate kinase|nr:thiamine-phosphate kinase [Crocinitomicaceae bacterium]MDG1036585.1 thiamine-phosphate kinase [Crocinitomicaceae bacterium]MDG1740985.1 thiamine-phosphate kinase [Crocinitomicaceae bacterium]